MLPMVITCKLIHIVNVEYCYIHNINYTTCEEKKMDVDVVVMRDLNSILSRQDNRRNVYVF